MKTLQTFILILVATVLITSVIYISRGMSWSFGTVSPKPFYLLFSGILLFFFVAVFMLNNTTSTSYHIIYKTGAILMGMYLFFILSMLCVDLIKLVIPMKPLQFGIATLALTAIVSVYGYLNAAYIRRTHLEIPIKGLTKEIKAVHLSDIHIGHFRTNETYLQRIIEITNKSNPDIVFFTGDYLDSEYALNEKFFAPLKKIKAPIFFVDGNHDHSTNINSILTMARNAGVNVLENQVINYGEIQIIGLTHMAADSKSFEIHASEGRLTIEKTLPSLNIDRNKPTILLHHSPNGIQYADKAGVDLYLSGHTHAGQIFPFNIFANMLFEYNRGLHTYNQTQVLVSEGIGTFGPPFRIGTKSEIILLKLKPTY